jgi:hypothetical protein
VNGAFPEMDRVPQGRKSERRLAPMIANQRERDDAARRVSIRFSRARQFEDVRENFDGNSVDGGFSVLPAGESYLYTREERG